MKRIIIIAIAIFCMHAIHAQRPGGKSDAGNNLRTEVQSKVRTILSELALRDKNKEKEVGAIITKQLTTLHKLQAAYDKTVKFAKDSMNEDKREHVLINVGNRRLAGLYKSHFVFEAELSSCLTSDEVEQVKEVMTGKELPKRLKALEARHPSLPEQQKRYVIEMLKAAREYALDTINEADKQLCFDEVLQEIERYITEKEQ